MINDGEWAKTKIREKTKRRNDANSSHRNESDKQLQKITSGIRQWCESLFMYLNTLCV